MAQSARAQHARARPDARDAHVITSYSIHYTKLYETLVALSGCTRDPSRSVRFMIWGAPEEIRVVQGITGREGQFHTEQAMKYGTRVSYNFV